MNDWGVWKIYSQHNNITDFEIRKENESTNKLAQLYAGDQNMPVQEDFRNTFSYRVGD